MKFTKLALSIEPNNLTSKVNYAKALTLSNKPKDAIKIFKQILKVSPDANNYINLGTSNNDNDCFIRTYHVYQSNCVTEFNGTYVP